MALQLYRKGNTHTVRGIECEVINVSLAEHFQLLESGEGWVRDPSELIEPVPEAPKRGRPKKEGKEDIE